MKHKEHTLKVFVGSNVDKDKECSANSKANASRKDFEEFSGIARAFEIFIPSAYKRPTAIDTPQIFQRTFHLEGAEAPVSVDVEVNFSHKIGYSKEKFLVGDEYFEDWIEALYAFKYQLVRLTY